MTPCVVERLPNGFTTAVVEVPGRHQVVVTLLIRAGGRFESTGLVGISHFLEHMLFRGSTAYPDAYRFSLAFEGIGGQPNAATGVESTEIYFPCHPDRLEEGLALLAELVRAPTFPELEKERAVIQDEVLYDYNEQGSLIHTGALAARLLWGDHPLAHHVIGTPETIAAISGQDLRAHHARYYTPPNMVLGLSGGVRAEAALALVRQSFGSAGTANGGANGGNGGGNGGDGGDGGAQRPSLLEGPPEGTGARLTTVADSDNQVHLHMAFPTVGYNAPEELALVLLCRLLDDGPTTRLQRRVREELGLVYHLGAEYNPYQDVGQFEVVTSIQPPRVEEVVAAISECLARFAGEGPDADELERAKQRHRLDLEFSRDSLDANIERHVWPLLFAQPRTIEEEWEQVAAISRETVRDLAMGLLDPARMRLVAVGPLDGRLKEVLARAVSGGGRLS